MKAEIENLRATIAHHNHAYYVLGDPEIPNSVYDRMFKKLQDLEKEHPEFFDANSPTCRVGSDLVNHFQSYEHLSPMLSINPVQSTDEIEAFSMLDQTVCELKYDGAGVNLIYKNGTLQKALTRGDGYKGIDVTANVRTIAGVPLRIQSLDHIEIRGEVWCPYSELKRLQSLGENVKSPLAVAINSLKIKYSDKAATRKLRFTAYYLTYGVAGSTHSESIQWLKSNHFETPVSFDPTLKTKEILSRYRLMHKDIPADGVVYKHDSYDVCEEEGRDWRSVRWAISWKFDKDLFYPTLLGTGGKVSTSGIVTMFAYFEPLVINNESITKVQIPITAVYQKGDKISIQRKGTRVAVLVGAPTNTRDISQVECPQCGASLVQRYSHTYCSGGCYRGEAPMVESWYKSSCTTKPDALGVDAGVYQSIALERGCRLIPSALRSNSYTLYYNNAEQLARIAYNIGLYIKSQSK